MLSIKKQNKTKKSLLILTLITAALCLVGVFFLTKRQPADPVLNEGSSDEQTQQDTNINDQKKEDLIKSPSTVQDSPKDTSSKGPEVSARQETDGSVTITSKLFGVSGGKCNLSMTKGVTTVTKTADIIYQPEFSTCAGFSIPSSELTNGEWAITLSVISNDKNVSTTTTVQVQQL